MPTIQEIISSLEAVAPLAYQESYDNAGLLVGDVSQEANAALLTLDITEEVIDEAIQRGCNLIVCHHPLIFGGLKKITGANLVERCVIKAIQNNIAIYASHTNMDSVYGGVNDKICEKLQLKNCKILSPANNQLQKLVFFVPSAQAEEVRKSVFEAGAGHIGNYDSCSFNTNGQGTFRGQEGANPFVGNVGEVHTEEEVKVETIVPKHLTGKVLAALMTAHPYEEVAYDIYPLNNQLNSVGIGMIGELETEMEELDFLRTVKETFGCPSIKYTALKNKPVKKVAVCGGAGSFLLKAAIGNKADVFISGDFKYHDYFSAEGRVVIADIGHYESEQFTKEVFYEILRKKFPKFALHLSEVITNPVNYLI
ncbi:Nif3-like dinuclear metal center hexameric protein [Prolixibacteraceae bacterium JC049]|nr:Nif3-like dinuclear metal center hexameric protein [Prolixibacteraceae bacterium JC049]